MALVHEKILEVMKAVGAIGKGQKADPKMGGYAFRGIDDLMVALSPCLAEIGLVILPSVTEKHLSEYKTGNNRVTLRTILHVTYTFYAEDGSSLDCAVIGEAGDTGDKSVNQAMTSAYKNAMFQAFHIATAEKKDTEHNDADMSGGKAESGAQGASDPTPPKPAKPTHGPDIVNPMKLAATMRCVELGLEPKDHGPICLVDCLRSIGIEDADGTNYTGKIGQLSAGNVVDLENTIMNWTEKNSAPGFEGGE